jgi:hypothetical protein
VNVGDHMILTRSGRTAEVIVVDTHSVYTPLVLCVCGDQCAASIDELTPLPRVHLDQRGRVALSVVKDNCEDD